ncbi:MULTISPECIES: LLM class F420-dependent oxidoreductase [unclassified Rhodococcus (in: high G+C Gram-positive bacteria)]|uniref:LLM class F420-dependent oxidoreductase n=1 Tax=unclassified Rhodococcus (in: high G+C Gram-positive bacteria) TaxID=192944 RepID=UPI001639C74A|nr:MULTISPECIES: LLM class F420-dependent oxidoreductase [unclassified Rhodococcus (in: high G+C Gram-positive bacteria)]MBC2641374.1 LLM class F420-dependent oxidoreductase [Rhodococcus sp. 3A]MBC2893881.1 LLM class F420-dependent oxidoreductase [Rhodococcus sp. 4CII]
MELRIFTEPQQGATYDDLLAVAQAAERFGYGAFFRSDHYLAMNTEGLPGPTDAWITLAGLARETSTIRLGTLVTSATFRHPGPLAISVAQVDQMSGGRVDLGIGAGWYEEEHQAYGIPFPPLKERFERLEESLAVITGLWRTPLGETFAYDGRHFTIKDSPALPKPKQPHGPPILIGGTGKKKTPALAAKYANEFNVPFQSVEETRDVFERVRVACKAIDRDPTELVYSNALVLCCGRTEEEIATRAARIGRDVHELRENGLAGSPAELVDKIGRYAEAGSQRIYLQTLDLADLDHLELVASDVVPQLS